MADLTFVVQTWPNHFLRDDLAAGVRDPELGQAYSLFRWQPYGRLAVFAGGFEWALAQSELVIQIAEPN